MCVSYLPSMFYIFGIICKFLLSNSAPNPFGIAAHAANSMHMGTHAPLPNPFMSTQQAQMPTFYPHAAAFPAVQTHTTFASPGASHPPSHFGIYPPGSIAAVPFTPGIVRPATATSNGPSQAWGTPSVHSQVPISWGAPLHMQSSHNPFLGAKSGTVSGSLLHMNSNSFVHASLQIFTNLLFIFHSGGSIRPKKSPQSFSLEGLDLPSLSLKLACKVQALIRTMLTIM